MAAGMKDVASLAGVAVGTVSNVLNHPDLVRPLTRARVEAAMEQLGFIPNGSARQLRAGRSRCLGLVVLDVTNPFFTEVARGVEDYAQAAGYAVILCNSDEADDKERRYLRVLEEQRVRGILITPVHGRAPELRRIRERGTPVVLLDRPGSAGQCSVAVDDRRGGEIAVSHLLGLGHRRIALVNGPVAIRQCADRRRGALRAVERAGLDPAAVLTEVTVPAMNARAGAAAADELLGGGPKPTAVFCTNDMLALGLLRRLGQAGVTVPGDLAVVGYDDIEFAADAAVPLTSVRQPKYQLGRAAAELLLDEADRPDQHEHRRFVFKPELVARASSGAYRRRARSTTVTIGSVNSPCAVSGWLRRKSPTRARSRARSASSMTRRWECVPIVASRESAVRAWPCPNSPTSAAANSSERSPSNCSCRDFAALSRHLVSVMLDLRLLISASPATQPTRSSSTFHSPASTPPGLSTRAISGSARSMSNQCMAWPASTASRLASGSGIASALPGTERTAGIARRNSASICGSGSTAVTSAPRPASVAVSLPVPAPRSATRTGWRSRTGSSAQRTAASA